MDFHQLLAYCESRSIRPSIFAGFSIGQIKQHFLRLHAAIHYNAESIPIPVHLFVSGEEQEKPALGWESIVPQHLLRVIPVEGNHQSMMLPPLLSHLGKTISATLLASVGATTSTQGTTAIFCPPDWEGWAGSTDLHPRCRGRGN